MSKYVILGCDHNMNDCIESWTISLTEYGLCVVYEKPDGEMISNGDGAPREIL